MRKQQASEFGALLGGYTRTQILHAAARLRLADELAAGPETADGLAARIGADPTALLRLLRALVVLGLVDVEDGQRFVASRAFELLRPDSAGSVRDVALFFGREANLAWAQLANVVSTGRPGFDEAFGKPFWQYMGANPEAHEAFNGTMTAMSDGVAESLAQLYDFEGRSVVVDVGGGRGHIAAALLAAHPQASGIVADVRQLEVGATRFIEAQGLADRCRFVTTNFFKSVPENGDLYVLKWIIHDWPDEMSVEILANCRKAMASDGRVLVVEQILPELDQLDASATNAVLSDLMMLALGGSGTAQERTGRQYRDLLAAAGLDVARVVPLAEGFSAIEARVT